MTNRFDVVCGAPGGREMHLDVYEPTGPVNRRTAVLILHGGGWVRGDRKAMSPRCEALARRGFSALAVEYRYITESPWPAQLADVWTAVHWTLDNADELGIVPGRLVLQGHSAGAHLALMAAAANDDTVLEQAGTAPAAGAIAAVVAYYPPVRLDHSRPMPDPANGAARAIPPDDGSIPAAMLLGKSATPEAATNASPLTVVGAAQPPTILFHGTADSAVGSGGALALQQKLLAEHVTCELHLVAGCDHEFDMTPSLMEVCADTVAHFLGRYVVDPGAFAREEAGTNPFAAMRQANRV